MTATRVYEIAEGHTTELSLQTWQTRYAGKNRPEPENRRDAIDGQIPRAWCKPVNRQSAKPPGAERRSATLTRSSVRARSSVRNRLPSVLRGGPRNPEEGTKEQSKEDWKRVPRFKGLYPIQFTQKNRTVCTLFVCRAISTEFPGQVDQARLYLAEVI